MKLTQSIKLKVFCKRVSILASCNYETNGLNRGVPLHQFSTRQLPLRQNGVAFFEPSLLSVR